MDDNIIIVVFLSSFPFRPVENGPFMHIRLVYPSEEGEEAGESRHGDTHTKKLRNISICIKNGTFIAGNQIYFQGFAYINFKLLLQQCLQVLYNVRIGIAYTQY